MVDNIIIREIKESELHILRNMLYEAIYQPDKNNLIPREVVDSKEVKIYIDDFGMMKDDCCFVADFNGEIVGAVWVRVLAAETKGYGYIDDITPEFAISLYKGYRNQGIGTALMTRMIESLKKKGYKRTSLSVHKGNYAVKLYTKMGFQVVQKREDDWLMVLELG